jgi:hypothetical protein
VSLVLREIRVKLDHQVNKGIKESLDHGVRKGFKVIGDLLGLVDTKE